MFENPLQLVTLLCYWSGALPIKFKNDQFQVVLKLFFLQKFVFVFVPLCVHVLIVAFLQSSNNGTVSSFTLEVSYWIYFIIQLCRTFKAIIVFRERFKITKYLNQIDFLDLFVDVDYSKLSRNLKLFTLVISLGFSLSICVTWNITFANVDSRIIFLLLFYHLFYDTSSALLSIFLISILDILRLNFPNQYFKTWDLFKKFVKYFGTILWVQTSEFVTLSTFHFYMNLRCLEASEGPCKIVWRLSIIHFGMLFTIIVFYFYNRTQAEVSN